MATQTRRNPPFYHRAAPPGFEQPEDSIQEQIDWIMEVKDAEAKPSLADLHWFRGQYEAHWPSHAPRPYLNYTPAGEIHTEWATPDTCYVLELDPETRLASVVRLDRNEDPDNRSEPPAITPDLTRSSGWQELARFLGVPTK